MTALLLRLLSSLCVAMVLAGQLGRWLPALDPLNALLGPLAILLGLLLALALRWGRRTTAVLCALGLAVTVFQLATSLPRGAPEAGGPAIRILTLSTYHANPHPEAIPAVVKAAAADIVVLQETSGTASAVVDTLLPEYFRVKSCPWQRCPTTILSRWPASRVHLRSPKGRALPDLLAIEVQAPTGRFRVIGVHLPRPYYPSARQFRGDLVEAARSLSNLPLLVAGDFNAPTGSFALNSFAQDTRLRPLEGYIPTYPANQPIPAFVAIDHVFADPAWGKASCRRTGAGNSDHFGVVCTLKAPAKSPR